MPDLKTEARPLSPHLQIYRWPITMLMSILHRITGIALHVGTLLLAAWLIAAAMGLEAFARFQSWLFSPLGLVILIGYSWALMLHMLGGIRHLIWDLGYGLERRGRAALSYATLIGSIVLTGLIWGVGVYSFAAACQSYLDIQSPWRICPTP